MWLFLFFLLQSKYKYTSLVNLTQYNIKAYQIITYIGYTSIITITIPYKKKKKIIKVKIQKMEYFRMKVSCEIVYNF